MATTAEQIIRLAYWDAQLTPNGIAPNTVQYTEGLERLNMITPALATEISHKLWLTKVFSVDLSQGDQTYEFGLGMDINIAKPMKVVSAVFRDADANRRDLKKYSRIDFNRLPNLQNQGPVTGYSYDNKFDRISLYVYMVPDAEAGAGTLEILIQQQSTTYTVKENDTGFPPEWSQALHWALAADLANGQPQSIITRCESKRLEFVEKLKQWDEDDSDISFEPDPQFQSTSEFR